MRYAVYRKIPIKKIAGPNKGGGFHIEIFDDYKVARETKGKIKKIPKELYEDVQGIMDMFEDEVVTY